MDLHYVRYNVRHRDRVVNSVLEMPAGWVSSYNRKPFRKDDLPQQMEQALGGKP
jgi:hypothetical protein